MKLEIPEQKKLVYRTNFSVKWGDMDAMGHVNNGMYFKYMEHSRVDWFREIGFLFLPNGQAPVIANAFCNFKRQLKYPDEVLLKLYVSHPARVTFDTWTTMERVSEPGVVCAAGGATVLWIDTVREKAVSLPEALRELVS
ncbi:acyl-CoA thioesterase [Comamonas sp. NoAH]|uniref:acyl-CoA thioesterase n=1 Tax=Comamonas halotolerans TaxID=3041496 RepID=UPI0024E08C39|nr:acyl-CoA thioesterase [Comamonas sp. NoAH]